MKRLFVFFIIVISVLLSPALAEKKTVKKSKSDDNPPLAVRGADIKDVSRIVLDGIPQNRYRVVPLNNQLNIVFEDFEYSFLKQDLLAIGLLKNIKKLSVDKVDNYTILKIEYSCPCQGDFYKWHNQKLVLDVFGLDAVKNPLRVNGSDNGTQKKSVKKEKKITEPSHKSEKKGHEKKNDQQKPAVSENFENYLKNLVQAANEKGLVEFKDSAKNYFNPQTAESDTQKMPTKISHDPISDMIDSKATDDKKQKNDAMQTVGNVHVSQDKVLSPEETERLLPTDKNIFLDNKGACLPDAAFKLPSNDPEHDTFYDKISDYRNDLIGEFDTVNSESALKLAYHYISYGLGEEALQVLSNFPTPEQRGYIAKSMAELLTNRTLSDNSVFKDSDKCEGVQSLWAAYRYFKLGDEKKAEKLSNFSGASEILKKFPVVLQTQIGSSLALNLVRQNDYKRATEMIDTLAMSKGQLNPYVLLVRGLIDAKHGLADRALAVLNDVVEKTNGSDQQMAGLALAELKLASDIPLTQRDISILEEIIFLKARELIGVQGLALVAENESRYGNFNVAFKRLSEKIYNNQQIKDPAQIKAEQLFKRIAVLGEGNDNPNTFNVYWDYPDLIVQKPVYLKAFAKRLFERGYDSATIEVIDHIQNSFPSYTQKNDVSYLKGQAFFRQGKYEDVIQAMNMPYDDDIRYMSLKAEAFHKLGKDKKAIKTLAQFNDKESVLSKARYALAGRQWNIASEDYEKAKKFLQSSEFYYRSKASAYMSGYQYPGNATQYKKPEDVVFHQPERQAKGIDNVVDETKKLIELIENRSQSISNLLNQKNIMNDKPKAKVKNG